MIEKKNEKENIISNFIQIPFTFIQVAQIFFKI